MTTSNARWFVAGLVAGVALATITVLVGFLVAVL